MHHHRVPCYGDLTPGIPDVADSKPAERLVGFLRHDPSCRLPVASDQLPVASCQLPVASGQLPGAGFQLPASGSGSGSGSRLFACLRLTTDNCPLETGHRQLAAVLAIARDFSPRVMTVSEREVLVDVSGLGRLIGPPDEIARQFARAVFDTTLKASVAIGRTQAIARLLAHAEARSARCEPGGAPRASDLALLPVDLLQDLESLPPAMNERDRARPYDTLASWGIATLGDLAALPAADLSSRLGRRGVALQRLAQGLDPRPFVPDPETPRFTARLELEWPIDALEPLSFVFARLLDPLSAALERADRGAIAVWLELRLTDRSTSARVLPLPAPMRDARVLRTLLLLHLESNPPPAAVDIVAIELDPAPARIVRFSLFDRARPSPETLSTLTARLSALVGESRVGSAVLLDSHAPDAFEMTRFDPESDVSRTRDVPASATAPAGPPLRSDDGKVAATAVHVPTPPLRRQRHPPAIRVAVERGRPVHIASSTRGIPYGAIVDAAGPWRTSGDWWTSSRWGPGHQARDAWDSACGPSEAAERSPAKPDRRAWDKDEWDVALKSGAVCRISRDRTNERWFFEGIYD